MPNIQNTNIYENSPNNTKMTNHDKCFQTAKLSDKAKLGMKELHIVNGKFLHSEKGVSSRNGFIIGDESFGLNTTRRSHPPDVMGAL
jgi:hypothetical protein